MSETKDLEEIKSRLRKILLDEQPTLRMRKDTDAVLEACGTKEVMQGKQKVDGHYFASIMPKPKDVRFYFFPIYTHVDEYEWVPDSVRKMLKGKSCFHIKSLDSDSEKAIKKMVKNGVKLYKKDGLI